ncbi:Protein S-acyltransferase 24 [Auxenochlorella protothecoides]|uniref:S-acyltransferase n=1 Tax=Auxenochlorella protothecoides TaxID=3075 RepID=A0A087SID4_AUXPR|nr:Protein S-acyltransferase 24 [Auxenochlorella protothecoides]KFM25488.1 Protein S-acyltransferase 24 [Auxenochlorella protothecoides]
MSKEPQTIDTVWKAAAYGDFDVLTRLAGADPSLLHAPDDQGFYALQWAALNNRVAVLTYLLGAGCAVDVADASRQTPLHWAAVRGSVPAAETLLRAGADLAARDSRGYTVAHVAAQYGQAGLLHHLALRWGADLDAPDADGRTPLHWAAYKGHADALRLLLFTGSAAARPDAEGCTPLHWAAIRGNAEACTLLLQGGAGECLAAADATGATPSQLAAEKGHRVLGLTLADARVHDGPPPALGTLAGTWASFLLATCGLGLASPALQAGSWGQICVACRIVRPLRAKHCGVTGRCIECYDHYCPWVGNVIGRGNRAFFLTFLWLELGSVTAAMAVAVARLHSNLAQPRPGHGPATLVWPVVFVVADAFLLLSIAALALAQTNQIAKNITTNELANWHRYKYLHAADGEFLNPFDRGWKANCAEVCCAAQRPRSQYVLEGGEDSVSLLGSAGGKLDAMV